MELVLPKRAIPQPQPHVSPGGDCGACVLAGLTSLGVEEVYSSLCDGKYALSYFEMRQALLRAEGRDLLDRVMTQYPSWPQCRYDGQGEWGLTGWHQSLSWWHYLRLGIDGGYYGVATVNYAKQGPFQGADHWVLLCGVQYIEVGNARRCNVLVSCSAKSSPDEEWVESHEFLRYRGGFNMMLARPSKT
jgi:hypothetical protein